MRTVGVKSPLDMHVFRQVRANPTPSEPRSTALPIDRKRTRPNVTFRSERFDGTRPRAIPPGDVGVAPIQSKADHFLSGRAEVEHLNDVVKKEIENERVAHIEADGVLREKDGGTRQRLAILEVSGNDANPNDQVIFERRRRSATRGKCRESANQRDQSGLVHNVLHTIALVQRRRSHERCLASLATARAGCVYSTSWSVQ